MDNWRYYSTGFHPPTHTSHPRQPHWTYAPYPVQSHIAYNPQSFPFNPPQESHQMHAPYRYQRSVGRYSAGRPHQYQHRPIPWQTAHPPPRRVLHRPRPSHAQQTVRFSPAHLGKKPTQWRSSYKSSSKGGLRRYLTRIGSIIPRVPAHPLLRPRIVFNPIISYRSSVPYDLRINPTSHYDPNLPLTNDTLGQLASSPSTFQLTLWHRKLPWHINISATQQIGLTVQDVLAGLYEELALPIAYDEYYTGELTTEDREMLNMAFQKRCRGDKAMIRSGVRRVDFLGQDCCFAGIARSRGGIWELKTMPRVLPRMMLD